MTGEGMRVGWARLGGGKGVRRKTAWVKSDGWTGGGALGGGEEGSGFMLF